MSLSNGEKRQRLQDRFSAELSWREGTTEGNPAWYSQLLTDLILATGDEPITYFSAKYVPSRTSDTGSVSVVAFTNEIVAYANFDGDSAAGASPLEVVVTARRSLSSFSLESSAAEVTQVSDALGTLRITVTYPQFSRTLPLGVSDWTGRDSETAELISCLRRDVAA